MSDYDNEREPTREELAGPTATAESTSLTDIKESFYPCTVCGGTMEKVKSQMLCPACEDHYFSEIKEGKEQKGGINRGPKASPPKHKPSGQEIRPKPEVLKMVQDVVSNACDKFVFESYFGESLTSLLKGYPCDKHTRQVVRDVLLRQLEEKGADLQKVLFEVVSNSTDTISVEPCNLYTAVVLFSGEVPSDIEYVEGDYYLSDGTVISYSEKVGAVVRPLKPVEHIKINFTIMENLDE